MEIRHVRISQCSQIQAQDEILSFLALGAKNIAMRLPSIYSLHLRTGKKKGQDDILDLGAKHEKKR